jgi:hypothetical protein
MHRLDVLMAIVAWLAVVTFTWFVIDMLYRTI